MMTQGNVQLFVSAGDPFKPISANYSNDEKNAMFYNTALKFYRLW
jgi:hypothetical protein